MNKTSGKPLVALGFWLMVPLAAGCADGPFAEIGALNPWVRRQWTADEEYGPTFHTRLDEFESLRGYANDLSPADQARFIQQLNTLVRNDPDALIRSEAAETLGVFSSPAILPGLQIATGDPDPEVRIAACRAWGRRGGSEAVEALGNVVRQDADLDVRIAATTELGRFTDRAAVEALGVALNENDPALQYRAVESLQTSTGRDFGESIPAWRDFVEGRQPMPDRSPSIVERLRRMF